jgi:hypothetical protein
METTTVLAETLKEYPGNPRKGNIDKIAESLIANGQYKPIVVQESTGYVLVGNHTLKAIKQLGWDFVDVVELDVNDEEAKRIVLADNRTSDDSTYDYNLLADMLKSMPTLEGTGYDADALDQLINGVNSYMPEVDSGDMESRGLGTPIIHYDIVFDTEEQQRIWYDYMKWLRLTYPEAETNAARLINHIRRVML